MPAPRVLDLTTRKAEPTGTDEFFSEVRSYYKNKEDSDIIGGILNEYEKAEDKSKGIQKAIFDTERNNQLSPSRKLAAMKTLRDQQDITLEEKKLAETQYKQKLDKLKDKTQVDKITEEFGLDPELTKDLTPAQAMQLGRRAEKGGVSSKPVPDKYSTLLDKIIDENPGDTPSQLQRKANKEGIPQTHSKPIIDLIQKEGEVGSKYAEKREISISDYVNSAFEKSKNAEDQAFAIDQARKAVSGEVTGPGVMAMLKQNPYTQLYFGLSPDEALLQAANKKLIEGNKGIFGAKPTEREIFLLLNEMLPSIGKTKEANMAGLDFIEKVNQFAIKHGEIVDDLTDGGKNYVPDLERQVQKRMQPLAEALRDELREAVATQEKTEEKTKEKDEPLIRVQAPDKTFWDMTQSQIDQARDKGINGKKVNFVPVK